jgi:hypothetical protein
MQNAPTKYFDLPWNQWRRTRQNQGMAQLMVECYGGNLTLQYIANDITKVETCTTKIENTLSLVQLL